MNITFDLGIVQDCVLQIKDTTQEYNEYLEEDNNNYVRLGRFKYSDTATLNIIKYKEFASEEPVILDSIITSHKNGDEIAYLDEAYYHLVKDGHYVIDHIVLPTIVWLQDNLSNPIISDYTNIYVTDGTHIYKYLNEKIEPCTVDELALIENVENTTVSKASQETFSICLIHKCYLNLCKDYFNKLMQKRCYKKDESNNFELDLIRLSIEAIKYNIEFGNLSQAQFILEDITTCTNLCKQSQTNHGCKCCQ